MKKILFIASIILIGGMVDNIRANENSKFISKYSNSNMELEIFQKQSLKKSQRNEKFSTVNVKVSFEKGFGKNDVHAIPTSEMDYILMEEDFESTFPNKNWRVFDGDSIYNGEYYWGVLSEASRSNKRAWCAADGRDALEIDNYMYPNWCNSWMVYGPINLRNAESALVKFKISAKCQEDRDYLFWMASTDNKNYYGSGVTGEFDGEISFDLSDVYSAGNLLGNEEVWLAFLFFSDDAGTDIGAFIDDIAIEIKNSFPLDIALKDISFQNFPRIDLTLLMQKKEDTDFASVERTNFSVLENGTSQDITNFDYMSLSESGNMCIAITFDYSWSMRYNRTEMNNIALVVIDSMKEGDNAAICKFSKEFLLCQTLTDEKRRLEDSIEYNHIISSEGSSFFKAIHLSLNELTKCIGGKKELIIFTDGENDNRGLDNFYTKRDIIDEAVRHNTSINIIGLDLKDPEIYESCLTTADLAEIAENTGGILFVDPDSNKAKQVYPTISNSTMFQYELSYQTNNRYKDGSRRNVFVTFNNSYRQGTINCNYYAPPMDTIHLSIQNKLVYKSGDEIRIPVWINSGSDLSIMINNLRLKLKYDPSILNVCDITLHDTLCDKCELLKNISHGEIDCKIACDSYQVTAKQSLIYLIGRAIGKNGESTHIDFESARVNNGSIHSNTINGLVTIQGISYLSGKIGYYPILKFCEGKEYFGKSETNDLTKTNIFTKFLPVRNVRVDLINSSGDTVSKTFTDKFGNYLFKDLPPESLTIKPTFKSDTRQYITYRDLNLLKKEIVFGNILNPYQKIAANADGNNDIGFQDHLFLFSYLNNKIDEFPVGERWTFVPTAFLINNNNWMKAPRLITHNDFENYLDNQDFYAIAYGDIDRSWRQSKIIIDPDRTNLLQVNDRIQMSSKLLEFDIKLNNINEKIHVFGITIDKLPEYLSIENVSTTELTEGYLVTYNKQDQFLKIEASGTKSIERTGAILKLQLKLKNSISYKDDSFTISSFYLNELHVEDFNKEIKIEINLPNTYALSQNYPNPFNSSTTIKYQIAEKSHVRIDIFNLMGQKVKSLVAKECAAGSYQVNWDGTDDNMNVVPSGLYIVRMKANDFVGVRKIALLK